MFICTHKWSQRHQASRVQVQEGLFHSVSHKSCSLNLPLRVRSHWTSLSSSYTSEGASLLSNAKGVDTSSSSGSFFSEPEKRGLTWVWRRLRAEFLRGRFIQWSQHWEIWWKNRISLALNTCEYSSWTIAFFHCNFRFSWFTRLSSFTANTKSHIQSKPGNSSVYQHSSGTSRPLLLTSTHDEAPSSFSASERWRWSSPRAQDKSTGFTTVLVTWSSWIYTGILGEKMQCKKINPELVPSSLTRFFILRESQAFVFVRFRDPSVVTFSVRGCLKLSKHSGAFLRSQPWLVLLIDSKARNPSRISHWSLIPGIKISSWAASLISVLWYRAQDEKRKVSCSLQQFIRQVFINHFQTPGNGPTRQTDIFKLNFIVRSGKATSRNDTVFQKLALWDRPAVFG